jgi:hypothetical protein
VQHLQLVLLLNELLTERLLNVAHLSYVEEDLASQNNFPEEPGAKLVQYSACILGDVQLIPLTRFNYHITTL